MLSDAGERAVMQGETHPTEFRKALGLFDSIMIVAGVMIGSGIFIVSAEISRQVGSAGWLLVAWVITGALTVTGALSYGELAAMMPEAGGMYIYLREAFSPMLGFLYGWTMLTVIQTGNDCGGGDCVCAVLGSALPCCERGALPPCAGARAAGVCPVALDGAGAGARHSGAGGGGEQLRGELGQADYECVYDVEAGGNGAAAPAGDVGVCGASGVLRGNFARAWTPVDAVSIRVQAR